MMTLHVFADRAGEWRWHLHARNGRKVATSGEAFDKHGNALRAARSMFALLPAGKVRLVDEPRH